MASAAHNTKFWLVQLDHKFWKKRYNDHVELDRLKKKLFAIHLFMNDADDKQIRYPAVKHWSETLRDTLHDMEDLVDEIFTDDAVAERSMSQAEAATVFLFTTILNVVCDLCCETKIIIMMMIKGLVMKLKIKLMITRLEELEREARLIGLKEYANITTTPQDLYQTFHPSATSLVDEFFVSGREKDKDAVISSLLSLDDGNGDSISVIPIVGMAGLGKTTLAQHAFNDSSVKKEFNNRIWVFVGFQFDILRITKEILESLPGNEQVSGNINLNLLQTRLTSSLHTKRFLLVIDDVCALSNFQWNNFLAPLKAGAKGSKIIVTTRNSGVARIVSSSATYNLQLLNEDDCWSILAKQVFGNEDPYSYPHLKEIGQQIARKCSGLPSIAYALGSLLRSKRSVRDWEAILSKNIWMLQNETVSKTLTDIRLSYYHLPRVVRQCFFYCSIFPKGYKFQKDKLVLLWMAEGFLETPEDERKEDVGNNYFNDLISSSFFRKSGANFVIPDLFTELAELEAGEFCFRLEDSQDQEPCCISEKLRHLSYTRSKVVSSEKFGPILGARRLRTFLPANSASDDKIHELNSDVLQDLLARFPRLRTLSLAFYKITKLPYSLGKLKHLRYLDVSYTPLKLLPESVCSVYNLQTLNLTCCSSLYKLPEGTEELINLRHLLIEGTDVQKMPLGMSRLTNLQTLSNFIVGKGGSSINELSKLLDLHGQLCISGLENMDRYEGKLSGILTGMTYLDELKLEWSNKRYDPEEDRDVLEILRPPKDLKCLVIESYGGEQLPKWLQNSSLSELVFLRLSNCTNLRGTLSNCPPSLSRLEIAACPKLVDGFFLPSIPDTCVVSIDGKLVEPAHRYGDASLISSYEEDYILEHDVAIDYQSPHQLTKTIEISNQASDEGTSSNSNPLVPQPEVASHQTTDGASGSQSSYQMTRTIDNACQDCNQPPPESESPHPTTTATTGTARGVGDQVTPGGSRLSAPPLDDVSHQNAAVSILQDVASESYSLHQPGDQATSSSSKLPASPLEVAGLYKTNVSKVALESESPHRTISSTDVADYSCQQADLSDSKLPIALLEVASKSDSSHQMTRTAEVAHQAVYQATPTPSVPQLEVASLVTTVETTTHHIVSVSESPHQMTEIVNITNQTCDQFNPKSSEDVRSEKSSTEEDDNIQYEYSSYETMIVSDAAQLEELPTGLQSLRIERWENLESLTEQIFNNSPFLQRLYIIDCDSLKSIPTSCHLPALKTLHIRNCRNLKLYLPAEMMDQFPLLEHLCIENNRSLEFFPLNLFPKLRILSLSNCIYLKSLQIEEKKDLTSLEALEIRDCPNLDAQKSFPQGLPSASKLISIFFSECKSLKSLPIKLRELQSLRSLFITKCPELESLSADGFPDSLNLLCITFCPKIIIKEDWGLAEVKGLKHFEIDGVNGDIVSFPKEGLLPDSLASLRISRMMKLHTLDENGLQKLNSLEKLEINSCKKLRSLPMKLPPSLSTLSIKDCPLLKAKLQNKSRADWSRIAHIPNIYIADKESH